MYPHHGSHQQPRNRRRAQHVRIDVGPAEAHFDERRDRPLQEMEDAPALQRKDIEPRADGNRVRVVLGNESRLVTRLRPVDVEAEREPVGEVVSPPEAESPLTVDVDTGPPARRSGSSSRGTNPAIRSPRSVRGRPARWRAWHRRRAAERRTVYGERWGILVSPLGSFPAEYTRFDTPGAPQVRDERERVACDLLTCQRSPG